MNLPTGQFKTWLEHITIAVLTPAVCGLAGKAFGEDALLIAATVSTFALAVFFAREGRDILKHADADRLDTHMDGTGVTPRIDQWGDLLGPVTATLCYWIAWVLA